jgi:hypothetical protein
VSTTLVRPPGFRAPVTSVPNVFGFEPVALRTASAITRRRFWPIGAGIAVAPLVIDIIAYTLSNRMCECS